MKRLARPLLLLSISVAAIVAFVVAGAWAPSPLDMSDISGWLRATDPVDAIAELARLAGLLLAMYVAVVSAAALVAEVAAILQMPRLTRLMFRLVHAVAVPALRKRLLEVAAVATVTASSLQALPAGAAPASRPAAAAVSPVSLGSGAAPAVRLGGEFVGFDFPSTVIAPDSPTTATSYTVQPDDTLWDIVEQHYGRVDLALLDQVVAANPDIRDPNVLLVGWTLALPHVEPPAATAAPTIEVAAAATPGSAHSTWAVVTVERGDTLWDIVDRHYGGATAELVWATVAANPDIEDPNLIFVGQQITLPPRAGEHPPPPVEPPAAVPAQGSPATEVPTVTSTDPSVPTSNPSPTSPAAAPSTVDPAASGRPVSLAPSPKPAPSTTAVEAPPAEGAEDTTPAVSMIVGWTGAAGLAAGLLALAARRRRRQPLAVRHARQEQSSIDVGVALRETENLTGIERAALALRLIGTRLSSRRGESTPVPRLLRVADGALELVWDTPNPTVIQPWRSPDGGWSWTLPGDAELEPTDSPSPCPTLVTIGRRNGADVLLNLETCGVLSVDGDRQRALIVARSIASELATSVLAESPTVLVVGELALAGQPEHARTVEPDEAVGWLRDRSESASALLANRRLTSLFALRARSKPLDAHEPVVVVIDSAAIDADQLAEIIDLAHGDLGAVVVLVGPRPVSEWRLTVGPTKARLDPLGLELEPPTIDEAFVSTAAEFIPDADPELDESMDDAWEEDAEVDGQHVLADHLDVVQLHHRAFPVGDHAAVHDAADEKTEVDWDVELKVLGQVRAIGTKEPLSPTELHLAIYLAFNRHGENADTIATMLWPKGVAARTVTNAMASLRRKLGTGADGEALFPLGRDHQYTYRLSGRVVTDWDRFVALVDDARRREDEIEEAQLLDEALGLVDGPPFRAATGYSWAYSDGTATLICDTVRAVAARAVDLHRSRGDQPKAARAGHRARTLLDDEFASESVQPSTS
jgi:nucleoid-associated protein YgaU